MTGKSIPPRLTRRGFAAALAAPALVAQEAPEPPRPTVVPEVPPFQAPLVFTRRDTPPHVQPFPMTDVRLLAGPFRDAQEWNRGYLHRLQADRLLHTFRLNAGLASSAEPLGGWEEPTGELRGHFPGHFLSACGLAYASTGDREIKAKGDHMVAELAKCQNRLQGGYLSAFPAEFFDRVKARRKVWAPFYTVHKVMAGMLDMYQYGGNQQALQVLTGMAGWADQWSVAIPEAHMQDILNTEFGGMSEVLYNLAAVTGDSRWGDAGDRFTKKRFFNPLALRRDELRGFHVNTHIPQVIGAARRYELSGDMRFHDVADFFWYEVTGARAYSTGGTSNDEHWLTEPRHQAEELTRSVETAECCCAYNMLKLTRKLYSWAADPRYFDYYERTLFNHRLGTIYPETGATMYYLSHTPGAWKTFSTADRSFWCCTGTGVEEYAKLNDSIYFHDDAGLYVNLFIASELNWRERGFRLKQETKFPDEAATTLTVSVDRPVTMTVRLRVPAWLTSGGSVKVNGKAIDAFPGAGSYLTLSREWKNGDRIEMALPMRLHTEALPDDRRMQAILYGPLVLAGDLGADGLTADKIVGPMGPHIEPPRQEAPRLAAAGADPQSWIQPIDGRSLTFRTRGQSRDFTLMPLNRIFDRRYSIYWQVG